MKTKAKPSKANWATADFRVGDELLTTSEINGMYPGQRVEVTDIQQDGAIFRVNVLTGELHGQSLRVRSKDLKLLKRADKRAK